MGDMVESYGVRSVGDDIEAGETACERFFIVGEVVEYWEGAYVRGERVGFGEPAFVKKVEGSEWCICDKNGGDYLVETIWWRLFGGDYLVEIIW